MLKNVISEFKAVFSREMFKAWWSELIKLCAKKPVLIIPQLPGNELKNEDEMLNLAYEKLCAISEGVFLHTFFKAENEETMENGAK